MIRSLKSIMIFYFFANYFCIGQELQIPNKISRAIILDDTTNVMTWGEMDSVKLKSKIETWIYNQRKSGHMLASLDRTEEFAGYYLHHLYRGPVFKAVFIDFDASNEELKSRFQYYFSNKNPLHYPDMINQWMALIVKQDSEHGYPFSIIKAIKAKSKGDTLFAIMHYQKGPKLNFRSIEQRKGYIVSTKYLERIAHLKRGKAFNQKSIDAFETTINKLPYIESMYPPRIYFAGQDIMLWLYLKKKPANKFDFLLGVAPDNNSSSRKYKLTGEASIDLWNSLKIGERLSLKYENLTINSPELKIIGDFPYIPFLPVGLSAAFNLVKFQEDYINLKTSASVRYSLKNNSEAGFTGAVDQSYLIRFDTTFIINNNRLPNELDYRYSSSGIYFSSNSLDQLISPKKGIESLITFDLGIKKIKTNDSYLKYNSTERAIIAQYDSLNANPLQLNINVKSAYYLNPKKRHVIKGSFQGHQLITKGPILNNELLLIGGFKSIRGFDEAIFRAAGFAIGSLEYRFLLDKNSFLNVFVDEGLLHLMIQNQLQPWASYTGIGAGIQVQTKAGAFLLQLGVGKFPNAKFDFSATKVHFGYTTLF